MFKKVISLALSVVFSLQTCGFAQVGQLNLAGYLGQGGGAPALDRFRPASLRYFSYEPHSDNFQILLDKADEKDLSDVQLKDKADELMRYFRIGLSLPNDKFWVNLRPDAPEQIIDPALERTDIGKIMLEADLQLKKDTSSLTSPQTKEGKEYWDKLYKKAGELFGSENITIPTITRPWIVPGEIIVRQSGNSGSTSLTTSAYIYKAALKVMLEEDYLNNPALPAGRQKTDYNFPDPRMKELNKYSTQLIRELIIPHLTKEVNRAKRYAGLRQVYYSLILARWFKGKFQGLSPKGTVPNLIDSGNLTNLTSQEPWSKDTYYQGYKKSFEQGQYNLSETVHTPTGQLIRRYVSGGAEFGSSALEVNDHFDVGKVNKGIPGLGDNGVLFNYASNDSKPVVTVASPLLESLKDKAMGRLNISLPDSDNMEEYNAMHVDIYKTGSIAELKEVFDYRVSLLKGKYKINNSEILDDFSNTLSVLILIEKAKITLEEEVHSIKNTYETYASLSKQNQLEDLLALVNELKETKRAMRYIARQIEKKWTEIVSSPISQEMKKIIEGIKQKTGELELILNKYEKQQGTFEEWEDLGNLFKALKSLYRELEIEFRDSFDPKVFLARRATEIGINRDLITKACKPSNKTEKRMEGGWSSVYPFSLSKEIFIAGTTYDRFYIEAGFGLDTIVLQRKGDEGYGAADIRLYIRSDSLEVLISDHRIKEELQTRIMNGDTLDDIVGPIKEALVQASKSNSALTLDEAKDKVLEVKEMFFDVLKRNGGNELIGKYNLDNMFNAVIDKNDLSLFVQGLEELMKELNANKVELKKRYDTEKSDHQASDSKELLDIWTRYWDNVSQAYDEMLAGFKEIQNELSRGASSAIKEEESGNKSVSTDEMKNRLNDLKQYLPDATEIIWKFGKFLSGRLNPTLRPEGFVLASMLAIYDLQKGKDGFTGKPIANSLVGYPPQVYSAISLEVPLIAEAVSPTKEFSDKVQEAYKSMVGVSSALAEQVGGIDFRAMDMLIQPQGSFKGLDFSPIALSGLALEAMDLEKDLEGINQMTLGRRRTHPQRLKEYISACIFKGKIDEKADDFILSMLEVFQLQSEEGIESASQDREAVVLADTRGYYPPARITHKAYIKQI